MTEQSGKRPLAATPDQQKFDARARKLARKHEEDARAAVDLEAAVLDLGPHRIGIPVGELREILRTPPLTRLPGLHPALRGLVQVRGELVSVIDLGRLLDGTPSPGGRLLALLEKGSRVLGVLAENLEELRPILHEDWSTAPLNDSDETHLLRGFTRDLLPILDVDLLLNDSRVLSHGTHPLSEPTTDTP